MKKYVARWKGDKIVLDQDDYKTLLERFDLNNFVEKKWQGRPYIINHTRCTLCKSYYGCIGCPFDLYPPAAGCIKIIEEVLEKTIKDPLSVVSINRSSIVLFYNIKKGKQAVALLRELLITNFKLVEE